MEVVDIRYIGSTGQYQTYLPQDLALINTSLIAANFGGTNDYIEYFVKDVDGNVLSSNYSATQYRIGDLVDPTTGTTTQLTLDPEADVKAAGYTRGIIDIKYNFFTRQLASSPSPAQNFWIKQISTSRTEIKVARQDLSNTQLLNAFTTFNALLASNAYYPTFYLNFGNDVQLIGVNAVYVEEAGTGYIIFKLYEPLPLEYNVKSTFWVVTPAANPAQFNVSINVVTTPTVDTVQLRGPNYKVTTTDKVSQTTPYYTYSSLFTTSLTSSYQQLRSMMAEKGITINVDYTDLNNFIHFSSATERLDNFVYKIQQIESASLGLTQTNTTQAKITLQSQIDSIITNFDGWEYYLYFNSGSASWPKRNNSTPYSLYSVTSSIVSNWLGSTTAVPTSTTMSMYWSASVYDNQNKDWLVYTVPQYLLDDDANAPYLTFLNMIGQHFDNVWLYLKDVSSRFDANNNPFAGISMDQVSEAIKSFGIQLYTNTNIADSLYYSLLGVNQTGSNLPVTSSAYSTVVYASSSIYPLAGQPYLTSSIYLPPFEEEKINRYVLTFLSASTSQTSSFQTLGSQQLTDEVYKRLYHNLPYLLKTRGTERGIKALIATFGVPADILPVHEYGGYDYRNVAGIQEISNTRILTGSVLEISSSLLSPFATIQYYTNDVEKTSINVQAGFSPADTINARITSSGIVTSSAQPGYFNIMQLIGDPALQYSSSYTPLVDLAERYFRVDYTTRYNVWDFIRLIKFYNNSLFKMLRDWVPARVSADTGIVIKSHMLERNKYPRKEPTVTTITYNADYFPLTITGSDGGSVIKDTGYLQAVPIQYNGSASAALTGSLGTVYVNTKSNIQKFTGEFSGSYIVAAPDFFPQIEVSSYLFPWTSSVPSPNISSSDTRIFTTYSIDIRRQNIDTPVRSQRFLDLDYTSGQLRPVNYGLITKSMQDTVQLGNVVQSGRPYSQYAYLQDYNYSSRPRIISRYSGSYLSGFAYNTYTPGDISYGADPVILYNTNRVGFFTQVATSSFLPGRVNATLAYLADVSGGLFELNQNNRNWQDIQNIFIAGTQATIKQFDNKKYSNQVSTDGVKSIYNSGYNYSPQLYFRSGSDARLYFQYLGTDTSTPFRGFVSGSPNSFISGATSPNYLITLDNVATGSGNIYNYLDNETPLTSDFATGSKANSVWPSYTASLAGQRTFTINLGINVRFPEPQTFGNQSVEYGWTAYKNNSEIIGSTQTALFSSQYSPAGVIPGTIIGSTPAGNVTITLGPYSTTTIIGPFNVTKDGVARGTIGGSLTWGVYTYKVGSGGTTTGPLPISATGDLSTGSLLTYVNVGSPTTTTLLSQVTAATSGSGVNISSSLLTINYTTPATNLIAGDRVTFRLRQNYSTTSNLTASFVSGASNSYLTTEVVSVGQGGYSYASTGSTGFITNITALSSNTSIISLNSELTSFVNYQLIPYFISGSTIYSSSLYTQYGDANYPFNPQFGDKILLSDQSGISQEVDVVSSTVVAGNLAITVTPRILDNWATNPNQISIFLLLRKYADEQNVILTFTKTPGQTSYGFLIPDTVSSTVVDNINTLQANVQSQLLANQSIAPLSS